MQHFHSLSHWQNSAIYDFLFISFRDFSLFKCTIISEPYKVGMIAASPGSPVGHLVTDLQDSVRFWHELFHSRFTCPWNMHTFFHYWQWHKDRETQRCSLMLPYQNLEKDFHTSPGLCIQLGRYTFYNYIAASFTWSCFTRYSNMHLRNLISYRILLFLL